MKKIAGFLALLCMTAGVSFAKVYNGDIQFHAGIGFGSNTTLLKDTDNSAATTEMPITAFNVDLETWHLFNFNDTFGLGFVVGFTGGFGSSPKTSIYIDEHFATSDDETSVFSFTGIIGPAVGITLGSVVRLNIGVGLTYGIECAFPENVEMFSYSFSGAGVGAEVQAKFVPRSVVSPIIGYRFTSLFSKSLTTRERLFSESTIIQFGANQGIAHFNNEVYAGLSINW